MPKPKFGKCTDKDWPVGQTLPLHIHLVGDTTNIRVRIWDAIRPDKGAKPDVLILHEGDYDSMENPFPFDPMIPGLHTITIQTWDPGDLKAAGVPFVHQHITIGVH